MHCLKYLPTCLILAASISGIAYAKNKNDNDSSASPAAIQAAIAAVQSQAQIDTHNETLSMACGWIQGPPGQLYPGDSVAAKDLQTSQSTCTSRSTQVGATTTLGKMYANAAQKYGSQAKTCNKAAAKSSTSNTCPTNWSNTQKATWCGYSTDILQSVPNISLPTPAQITQMLTDATNLMNNTCLIDTSPNSAYTALKTAVANCTNSTPEACQQLGIMMISQAPPAGVSLY